MATLRFFPKRRSQQPKLPLGFLFSTLLLVGFGGSLWAATVGTVVPILGEPRNLAFDATRKLLLIVNTTQNRIEVYSQEQGQLLAPIPVGRKPVGIAIIAESSVLLVCNTEDAFLTVVDLSTLSQTATIPITRRSSQTEERPFSIASLSGNKALLSTNVGLQVVDVAARTTTPIQLTGFTIPSNSNLVASGDSRYVLGQGGGIAFLYNPLVPLGLEQVRLVSNSSLLAADPTGSRFLIGDSQFDRQFFQTAQVNPFDSQFSPIGGIGFSADGSRVFAGTKPSTGAQIQVLATTDLKLVSRFRVPEPITGAMITSADNSLLFAVSLSGITVVDLDALPALPSLNLSSRILHFPVSACGLAPITQTVQITNSGGGTFTWKASTTAPNVTVEPATGNGEAPLQIKLNPSGFSFRGTALLGSVLVTSDESISGDQTVSLRFNLTSPDQIGTVFPLEGFLTDILVDDARERVYLVNSSKNQLEVFSTARQEFLPAVALGSIPKSVAFSQDKKRLYVTHLGTEHLLVLDAETLQQTSLVRIPHPTPGSAGATQIGTHPFSAAEGANDVILAVAATLGTTNRGTVYRLNLDASTAFAFPSLGATSNQVNGLTFLAASGNNAFILLAEAGGTLRLYDATTGNFAITRPYVNVVAGNVAASADGSWYHTANQVLDSVLVPQEIIPSGITAISVSATGFAFAPSGGGAYRGIRPAIFTSGLPSFTPPRIEKLDTATNQLIAGFNLVEALAPNSTSPLSAILRQLAVDSAETTLYGITDSGLMVVPLPASNSLSSPRINPGGVVNAASFALDPAPVAAGSIASVFGTNLVKSTQSAGGFPLPTLLGAICITFDGFAAPFIDASAEQLNVQIPWELSGRATATAVVSSQGVASPPVTVNLARQAPGIFTLSKDGQGAGAILHASDFSLVTTSNPAKIGEIVSIFGTGLGPTAPSVGTGLPVPLEGPLHRSSTPTVTMGSVNAPVLFAGLAPGYVGLYQVDVRIPSNTPVGTNVPVTLTLGGRSSNPATLAVVPALP